MSPLSLTIRPRTIAAALLSVIAVLSVLNALTLVAEFGFGHDYVKGLSPMFRLNAEGNIPTFFSALLLLSAAAICAAVAIAARRTGGRDWTGWAGLAAIALFLTLDEAAQIHELLDRNRGWAESFVRTEGVFLGPWVIAYSALVLIVAVVYLPMFLRFASRYRRLFATAAALYVGGAIGVEMIGATQWSLDGDLLAFEVINSIEEMMEMTALTIAIYALVSYAQETFGWRRLTLSGDDGP